MGGFLERARHAAADACTCANADTASVDANRHTHGGSHHDFCSSFSVGTGADLICVHHPLRGGHESGWKQNVYGGLPGYDCRRKGRAGTCDQVVSPRPRAAASSA